MNVIENIRPLPDGGFEYEAIAVTGTSSGLVWTAFSPVDPSQDLINLRARALITFTLNVDWIPPALLQAPIVWQAGIGLGTVAGGL